MTLVSPASPQADQPLPRVRRATGHDRLPVLARLLGRDAHHAARFERFAADERLSLDHLWGAFDDSGRVNAALLLTPYPGRTAMLTLSTLRSREEESAAREALLTALSEAATMDLAIVQALFEPRFDREIGVLRDSGFRRLAALASMERAMARPVRGRVEASSPLPPGATLEGYADDAEGRRALAGLLEATYRDTLDCPGLAGMRRPEEVLEGHRRGGRFDRSLWTILRLEDEPVGAVLLNAAPQIQALELVYLGLVPEARGRGFGRVLLERALSLASREAVNRIVLAVDEENTPALRLYRAAGFRCASRRVALVRPLRA
ncbi:MAG: GNAT family N-acetyltransferase [Phycisphaeraceae bacterium]|nr:GNAT family N-acetyltransferase [Phycisphaeraceae bacterium]